MPAPVTQFTNYVDARKYFDAQRSALARVLADRSILIFVPASASIGHPTSNRA